MKISETFLSIQGEGHLTGKVMFFIRTQGCSVKCPIREQCDQQEALGWKGEDTPVTDLVEQAISAVGRRGWVCVTGGEPTMQKDFPLLIESLRREGMYVHIQTSGAGERVNAQWDWLTVSPKASPSALIQRYGNELKLVYQGQSLSVLRRYYNDTHFWNYYLQPLWFDGGCNMEETIAAVHQANKNGMPWELSIQAHKYMGVH